MIASDREWHRVAGAPPETIVALCEVVAIELPPSYYDLLAWSNGGEGPLAKQPYYFCLDAAEDVENSIKSPSLIESFPGFLVFGSSGGGESVAFDVREAAPWPIVSMDMTNIDLAESVQPIAPDFDAFLAIVGLESPEA